MSRWFVEERRFDGGWSPSVYYGAAPTEDRSECKRRFRNPPRLVPQCYDRLSLSELVELYSPDGRFYAITLREEHRAAEGDNAPAAGVSAATVSAPAEIPETPDPKGAAPAGTPETPSTPAGAHGEETAS